MTRRASLVALVMVVKDEAAVLPRCLEALRALDLVDAWTVCDTGSTDDTRRIVRDYLGDLPGRLYRHQWRSFGHNRTLALRRARGSARWLLMLDADYVVKLTQPLDEVRKAIRRRLPVDALDLLVHDADLDYWVPRLTRGDLDLRYVGATHEYLNTGKRWKLYGLEVDHLADGSSRAEKFARDLALLTPGVEAGDPRDTFYMAQTLRNLGRLDAAAILYDRRARQNGWDEERWYAAYQAAKCRGDIDALIEAWRERPWRHEPLTAAAQLAAAHPAAALDLLFLEPLKGG